MSTPIQEVPDVVLPAPFPTTADRIAGQYNAKAKVWADSEAAMATRQREISLVTYNNAIAATEQALAAQNSRVQAGIEITAIKDAAISATTAIKDAAAVSAAAAADSATAAQAVANFAGRWSEAVGQMPKGTTVYHLGKFWVSLEALADVTLAEPGVSAVWAKVGGGIETIAYDDRATLRTLEAVAGDLALVDGLGLFAFTEASTELDDDESCFATSSGRWLMECPHWDVVSMWQLPDDAVRDEYDEDEPLRFASSFASKVLSGTATCAITSFAATASASFTGAVTGASVGDRVIATPPAELGATSEETGRLSYHAWVSAANTVTVMLTNASASSANTNTAIRTAWPITVIKS